MERIKIDDFKAKKMRQIKKYRKNKRIEFLKGVIILIIFSAYIYFMLEYILDNLL